MVFARQSKQGFQRCESITCSHQPCQSFLWPQQAASSPLGSRDQMPWLNDQRSLIEYKETSTAAKHAVSLLVLTSSILWHQSKTRDGDPWSRETHVWGPCGVTASEQSPVPGAAEPVTPAQGQGLGSPAKPSMFLSQREEPWKSLGFAQCCQLLSLFFSVAFSFIPCLTTWSLFFIPQQQTWKQNHYWAANPRISIFCTHMSLHPNNKTWRHTSIEATHKTSSLLQ